MTDRKRGTRHSFFIYLPPHLVPKSIGIRPEITINDKDIAHRVMHVLRLGAGDSLQFFTGTQVIDVTLGIASKSKNSLSGTITGFCDIEQSRRLMTVAIGLLKKDAMEAAVYSAAQMGASVITPVLTEKSRQQYLNTREPERLESTIIAACEQAKNPHIPKFAQPVTLEQILNRYKKSTIVCFDATGVGVGDLHTALTANSNNVAVLIGPEGGFVPDELAAINDAGAVTARLTSTILRSKDAACLGIGLVSCVVK